MTGAKKELGLAAYSEAIYPRFHFGWSDLRALTSGRYKFVAAPRPELYDLQQDPGESHNIYPERQALGDRMNQELVALEQRMSTTAAAPKAAVEVDPDARARLAALGYVGTFVTAVVAGSRRPRRSEGQDSALQPDDAGARDRAARQGVRRRAARAASASSRRIRR